MTTVASFFGACVAIVLVATLAPPLARLALQLPVAGIFLAHAGRAGRRLGARARLAAEGPGDGGVGLIIGMVGQDNSTGFPRFTFGFGELYEGVNFVVVVVAMFGLAEIIHNAGRDSADMPAPNACRCARWFRRSTTCGSRSGRWCAAPASAC